MDDTAMEDMKTMEDIKTFNVEGACWDLLDGSPSNMIGKLLLRGTSICSKDTPDSIQHVGIIVYNRLYEYGYNGVRRSTLPKEGAPIPQYQAHKFLGRELLGETVKTRQEFVEWLVSLKYEKYAKANYDILTRNCLHFAQEICQFLDVPYPTNWDKIINWAKDHTKLAEMFLPASEVRRSSLLNDTPMEIPEVPPDESFKDDDDDDLSIEEIIKEQQDQSAKIEDKE